MFYHLYTQSAYNNMSCKSLSLFPGHNQHYGLHLVGSVWEGTILELYQGLTNHKQPLYGLDFILEYNISTENKVIRIKVKQKIKSDVRLCKIFVYSIGYSDGIRIYLKFETSWG